LASNSLLYNKYVNLSCNNFITSTLMYNMVLYLYVLIVLLLHRKSMEVILVDEPLPNDSLSQQPNE
jgi:hypothetical protein